MRDSSSTTRTAVKKEDPAPGIRSGSMRASASIFDTRLVRLSSANCRTVSRNICSSSVSSVSGWGAVSGSNTAMLVPLEINVLPALKTAWGKYRACWALASGADRKRGKKAKRRRLQPAAF
jgi:hypothetical protein